MNVATRLWLGFLFFIIIIVLMSVTTLMSFTDLGGAIDTILKENYRSAVAANSMIEAIERMDSAYLAYLIGEEVHYGNMLEQGKRTFDESFQSAWSNITLDGEKSLLIEIKKMYGEFTTAGKTMSESKKPAWAIYSKQFFPIFNELKQSIINLVVLNQNAMLVAENKASNLASYSSTAIVIITVIGLFIVMVLGRVMTKTIISPLHSITNATKSIAQGALDTQVFISGHNEISELAKAINVLTENLHDALDSEKSKVFQAQLLALSLLNSEKLPALIIDGSNRIVLFNKHVEQLFNNDNQLRENIITEIECPAKNMTIRSLKSGITYKLNVTSLVDTSGRQIGRKILLE